MSRRVRKGETCPAGLGRVKLALGGWLGQVRLGKVMLAINEMPFRLKTD